MNELTRSGRPGRLNRRLKAMRAWVWPETAGDAAMEEAPLIRRIYLLIGLGLGGFLLWAAVTPLAGGVVCVGEVMLQSNRKTVQHLEGGIVDRILVRDGQSVKAGQVLIGLRDVQSRGAYGAVEEHYWALRALQARLEQEARGGSLIWPADLLAAAAKSAEVARQVESQKESLRARRAELAGREAILEQQGAQLIRQRDGVLALSRASNEQLETVRSELGDMRSLLDKGLATRPRVLALERAAQGLEGDIASKAADASRLTLAANEVALQIRQTRRQRLSEVQAALEKVRTDLGDLQGQRSTAADVYDRTIVRAPVAGAVMGLSVFTPGGVVRPGEPLMQIVPKDEAVIVKAVVAPQDIDSVRPEMDAEVQFVALPSSAPRLKGKVTYVSGDIVTDPQRNVSLYQTQVAIPPAELRRLAAFRLTPGMPVQVIVQSRKRTALDYLLGPVFEIFSRAFREE